MVPANELPLDRVRPTERLGFWLLALLVGVAAGCGAAVFRALIAAVHNFAFLGQLSFAYDANTHTPTSVWGPLVILVPVVGAIFVAALVRNFAPEAKGHGVPEVIDAIYYKQGVIRPAVAAVKSLASAISIGTGGSVGREGPIIQIGASFASTVAQILGLAPWQRITLIAAGAGAGIAATFNTPVGGVLFAIEIVMCEVSARTLIPVMIATSTATHVGRLFFGPYPSFVIPQLEIPRFQVDDPWQLAAFLVLGLAMGVLSMVFIRALYAFEDGFERIPGGYYAQHMLGMLLVGVLMYVLHRNSGHYYVQGVGYATIQDVLSGDETTTIGFLLALCGLKLLATCLTLGSGASGGVFSPSLFLGATFGGAFGMLLDQQFPGLEIQPAAFALAGMAGMVGGTTAAPMTAIVMIFEMTLDYNVIIPLTITVALAYGIRKMLYAESIYTTKLSRRGHRIPEALRSHLLQVQPARQFADTCFAVAWSDQPLADLQERLADVPEAKWIVVHHADGVLGALRRDEATRPLEPDKKDARVRDARLTPCLCVAPDTAMFDIIVALHAAQAEIVLVESEKQQTAEAREIQGFITKEAIFDAQAAALEIFA